MKKKVAFIGSSPIICLYIDRLRELAHCTVFEGGKLGGAWVESVFKGKSYPETNNIICPANLAEENLIADIGKELLAGGANISLHKNRLDLLINYIPEQYYVGHFSPMVRTVTGNEAVTLKRQQVAKLEIHEKYVILDGEMFDVLVMPSNFLLHEISVMGNLLEIGFETIVSKHVRVLFSEPVEGPHFSENFDNVFDRGGMIPPEANVFIGRVRREMKEKALLKLVAESSFIRDKAEKAVSFDMNFYSNQRAREGELSKLRERIENTAAFCVETRQFIDAYSRIPEVCAAIERRLCA
jgi:hypothetical protein